MNTDIRKSYLWVANLCAFIAMVAINILANALPIANIATSQVSAMYPTLITPAGITFAIWGLIYTLVGVWVISSIFAKVNSGAVEIGPYFIIVCALDIAWIFTWHYQLITLSLVIIVLLMLALLKIYSITRESGVIARTTFSIFYAWITVATIISLFATVKFLMGGAPVTPIQPRSKIVATKFLAEADGNSFSFGKSIGSESSPEIYYAESDAIVYYAESDVSPDYIETRPAVQGDIMLINEDEGLLAEGDPVPISVNGWDDIENAEAEEGNMDGFEVANDTYNDTTDNRPIITGGDPVITSYAGTLEYVMTVVAILLVGGLAIFYIIKFEDLAYVATFIWALLGIMYKQLTSPNPPIVSILFVMVAISAILIVTIDRLIIKKRER